MKSPFKAQLKNDLQQFTNLRNGILEDLLAYNKETWCKSFSSEIVECHSIDNHMCESFNAWILGLIHKVIIKMNEEIRHKLMNRHGEIRAFTERWVCNISLMTIRILREDTEHANNAY